MKKTLKVLAAILVAGLVLYGVITIASAKVVIDPPYGITISK